MESNTLSNGQDKSMVGMSVFKSEMNLYILVSKIRI